MSDRSGSSSVPSEASVVVVGGGLSGLVTARELAAAGLEDVVVMEAQDRVGGRLRAMTRRDGRSFEAGGEFTGPIQAELQKLAAELGVATEPWEFEGKFVRVHDGERHVESYPGENDPAACGEYEAVAAKLAAMIAEVPAEAPWSAPQADQWDATTVGRWLDENVSSPVTRSLLDLDLVYTVDNAQTSLLYMLWAQSSFGGWGKWAELHQRFAGGASQIPERVAAALPLPVLTSAPVRRVEWDDGGATVHGDGGSIRTRALVFALEPGQIDKIEFEPRLPPDRALLQARWQATHGSKFFAVYDTPFWLDEGLAGIAIGPEPLAAVLDGSPADRSEGILIMPMPQSNSLTREHAAALADPEGAALEMAKRSLATYFGDRAAEPSEIYWCSWFGDRWSEGCCTAVPTGVLTTVGRTLKEPIGPLLWAGADTGDQDWMEGAVTAGQRAASEALARV